jgi:hypothetical protein
LLDQVEELTFVSVVKLFFELSNCSAEFTGQFLGAQSDVFKDSGSVEIGDSDIAGEGEFLGSNLFDASRRTFGGLAQAP